MESLPSDIIQDIVSRVPAESVLECKLVCKRWGSIMGGSNFKSMHLSRQLNHLHGGHDDGNDNQAAEVESCLFFACCTDHPDVDRTLLFHGGQLSDRISIDDKYIYNENLVRIYHPPMHHEPMCDHLVGSCNGLVCAFHLHDTILDPIYICNPLTREYVYLPELVVNKEDVHPDWIAEGQTDIDMYCNTSCGFGYVRSTDEYKVVRIQYIDYEGGIVEVYTLGSGSGWRAIGRVPYDLYVLRGGKGTYANDAIYWTAYNRVVAFDLAKEEFRLLSVPPRMGNRRLGDMCGLVALGRNLCLYMDDKLHVEIWSLMESSNSKETWCLEFDINYEAVVGTRERKMQPIFLAKNGEIIVLYAESVLYSYDKKTTFLKMISNEASDDDILSVEAFAHINTFASFEAMGEPSKRYTVRPRRVRSYPMG